MELQISQRNDPVTEYKVVKSELNNSVSETDTLRDIGLLQGQSQKPNEHPDGFSKFNCLNALKLGEESNKIVRSEDT